MSVNFFNVIAGLMRYNFLMFATVFRGNVIDEEWGGTLRKYFFKYFNFNV